MRQAVPRISTLLGIVLFASLGCEPATERRPVSGTVSIDGVPVSQGSIMFLPDVGQRGVSASSTIREGKYQFTEQNGPTAGTHRVVIGVGATSSNTASLASDRTASPESSSSESVALDPMSPAGSTAAKKGPANSQPPTPNPREPKAAAVDQTRWETLATVPAADSPDAEKPIHFMFERSDPATHPAKDTAP